MPPALPSGLVTFVFTDIEGSTRMFRQHPDLYPALLARHREILRSAWDEHGGAEVGTEGDGMLVAFGRADEALLACRDAQRGLAAEQWPEQVAVRVRMGAHTGLATPIERDYVAMAVHQAARVASAAHGGQVIVSGDTAAAAGDTAGFALRALGRFRVRDFTEPVALFQVDDPQGPPSSAGVRAIPAEGHNLSRPPTSFVGRERDVAAVRERLAPGAVVTVVGPGGVGKSRLAIEVGLVVAPTWPDGVWRVVVDELPPAASVAQAVAEVLSVRLQSRHSVDDVVEALVERHCLLLLDGCEAHLADTADLVIALRDRCPGVGALVTSREPLHVPGEWIRRLQPLPIEGPGLSPAVALFMERARAANPDAVLDERSVAELVQRLDGLPLALEVAAGFSGGFSPAQMLAGLEEVGTLPRSRDRALPERQRSLDDLLGWSERLLSPPEQAVLRRLSVFVGSFTLSAARAAGSGSPVEPTDISDHLWSLVDRSLVVADPSAGGTRYRMLELVRRFAGRRLEEADEEATTVRATAAWFNGEVGPDRASDRTWVGRVAAEVETLRSLVERLAGLGADDATLAAELAASVTRYLEGVQAYRPAIEQAERWSHLLAPSPGRVALLTLLATLHLRLDEVDLARPWAEQAAQERDAVGSPEWDEVGVERVRGEIANRSGHPAEAVAVAQDALSQVGSARSRARLFNLLGIARIHLGDVEAAAAAFAQELDACYELGDDLLTTRAEANAAELALRRGLVTEAAAHQRACLDLAVALGQPVFVAYSMIVAARLQRAADHAVAVRLLSKALLVLEDTRHRLYTDDEAQVRRMLAESLGHLGEQAYGRAQSAGRALALDEAARLADTVLREAADP